MSGGDIFLGLLAILFPPIAVWIKRGICSGDSLINILLSCVGYIPGLIHAWYIIARYPEEWDYEAIPEEGGRVTYYYVSREPPQVVSGGEQRPSGTGAPDGGRAHRQLQRGGSAYGTLTQGEQQQGEQQGQQAQQGAQQQQQQQQQAEGQSSEQSGGQQAEARPPPTYAEAVRGDHKIQTP